MGTGEASVGHPICQNMFPVSPNRCVFNWRRESIVTLRIGSGWDGECIISPRGKEECHWLRCQLFLLQQDNRSLQMEHWFQKAFLLQTCLCDFPAACHGSRVPLLVNYVCWDVCMGCLWSRSILRSYPCLQQDKMRGAHCCKDERMIKLLSL